MDETKVDDKSSVKDKGTGVVPNAGSSSSSPSEEEKVSSIKVELSEEVSSPKNFNMSKLLEPPAFISDKSYADDKADLRR